MGLVRIEKTPIAPTQCGEFYELSPDYQIFRDEQAIIKDNSSGQIIAVFLPVGTTVDVNYIAKIASKCTIESFGRGHAAGKIKKELMINFLRERVLWETGNDFEKHYLTVNGEVSKRPHGNHARAGVIGFIDRKHVGKKLSGWTKKNQIMATELKPLLQDAQRALSFHCPYYESMTSRVQDYSFLESCFTSVTVNNSFRTAVHADSNNMKNSMSVMAVAAAADCAGYELMLPEYKVAFDVRSGGFLLLDSSVLHCNNKGSGKRISMVMYARESLCNP